LKIYYYYLYLVIDYYYDYLYFVIDDDYYLYFVIDDDDYYKYDYCIYNYYLYELLMGFYMKIAHYNSLVDCMDM